MSENHVAFIEPMKTLPRMMDDDPDTEIARRIYQQQVKKRLTSLDLSDISFENTGEVEVRYVRNGETIEQVIPIKTIPEYELNRINEVVIKATLKIPKVWNPNIGDYNEETQRYAGGYDIAPNHPDYADRIADMRAAQRRAVYEKMLYGIDFPITMGKEVIWDSDPAGNRDMERAIVALQRTGITEEIVDKVVSAIDDLGVKSAVSNEADWEKKSTPPSVSPEAYSTPSAP